MRIYRIRISGFKAIPFVARLYDSRVGLGGARSVCVDWSNRPFEMRLPVNGERPGSLLGAIIGANSTGKSSILHALAYVFGTVAKLDPALFHQRDVLQPVMVELVLQGAIDQPDPWHDTNCVKIAPGIYRVTALHVWQHDKRTRFIQRADGRYHKLGAKDRGRLELLQPQFRLVDTLMDPSIEADLGGNNLIGDLIDHLIAQTGSDSAIARMAALLDELRLLATRADSVGHHSQWADLVHLEAELSRHVETIAPTPHQVRLLLAEGIPSIREIFAQGDVAIDNGTALNVRQHGMGMQRGLIVSVLQTWCQHIRVVDQDYLFAIEEPEIFLHPHATRVFMQLLEQISSHSQVLFTSHSSEFVNRVALSNTTIVQQNGARGGHGARVTQPTLDQISRDELSKVQRYLREDRSDMLFARAVLLVEGQAELFAVPAFARTIGLDLDYRGRSVVFVNGIGNFSTYHEILAAFQIPHVILVDGDGRKHAREQVFGAMADALHVLDVDFETSLVEALSDARLLEVMNECLRYRGRPPRAVLGARTRRVRDLVALGKPLVGRVAGEMLTPEEVLRLTSIVDAIRSVVSATGG